MNARNSSLVDQLSAMDARIRFIISVIVLGLLMTGPFLLTVGILWADLGPEERAGFLVALDRWLPIGGLITIMALIVGLQLLRALFQQYVQGLLRMAETLRLMTDEPERMEMVRAVSPFGDGRSSARIARILETVLIPERDDLLIQSAV